MVETLKEALTTTTEGLKVIIAESECMLAKQRRERAERAERLKKGRRDVRQRFGVDEDVCTGDHSCIRLSGCPSLTIRPSSDILRTDPKAQVNDDCVGCGLCGAVAHAAILCPAFHKAEIVSNPSSFERLLANMRQAVISMLSTPEPVRLVTSRKDA
jgi:indolepyruvate ferredoxin oxidoreductase alpha subunit